MACGIAIAALVFSIITLVFEVLGVIFCFLSLILPEKTPLLPFSKWFVVAHVGVYFGTLVFYAFHFFIKKYTYDDEKYDKLVEDDNKNWKAYDFCFFAIPKSNKNLYPDGNGYKVYWGHIFLFIVALLGIVISIIFLLPVKIKIFGLLYVIIGFVHVFMVWVVFLSVSVPNLDGAVTPGDIRRSDRNGWSDSRMCETWCDVNGLSYGCSGCPFWNSPSYPYHMGLCAPYQTKWEFGGVTWEIPKDWAYHGCDNGQEVSNTRNFNFLFVLGKKAIEAQMRPLIDNKDIVEFHRNNFHPWFFSYELVFFIAMSIFYVGFVLVNFNIDFKGSLLTKS